MKSNIFSGSLAVLGLVVLAATIQAATDGGQAGPGEGLRGRLIQKFDKDGDGKLSPEERAAAKEAVKNWIQSHREQLLQRFDKNGDGKLDDQERAAAKEALKSRLQQGRGAEGSPAPSTPDKQ